MATQTDTTFKTFQATAAAIAKGALVKINSSGLILVTGDENLAIGVTLEDCVASEFVPVKLWGPTTFVTAAGAITQGAKLFSQPSGRVDDATAGTGVNIGLVALEAATAAGDIIEAAQFR